MAARAFTSDNLRASRDQIVIEQLPVIKKMAARIHRHLPPNIDLDDLVHAGIVGLLDAVDRFDPERHVHFTTFAEHRVRGAMLDSLRRLDWATRSLRRRQRQAETAARKLAASLQRAPASEEMARELGMDLESWHKLVRDLRNAEIVSADTACNVGLPPPDLPCNPEIQPDLLYGHQEIYEAIHVAMEKIPPGHRKVLSLYYERDMKMKEIGGSMGIDRSRISQIHRVALAEMRNLLQTVGVPSASAF